MSASWVAIVLQRGDAVGPWQIGLIVNRETKMISRQIARRTALTRTGFGLGAAIGAGLGSSVGLADAKAGPGGDVWSQGYLANKGSVKLAMYRKWPGNLGGWPDKPLRTR
jgi:hypothetical protein